MPGKKRAHAPSRWLPLTISFAATVVLSVFLKSWYLRAEYTVQNASKRIILYGVIGGEFYRIVYERPNRSPLPPALRITTLAVGRGPRHHWFPLVRKFRVPAAEPVRVTHLALWPAVFFVTALAIIVWIRYVLANKVATNYRTGAPRCAHCGYDLRSISKPRCPEWGTVLS